MLTLRGRAPMRIVFFGTSSFALPSLEAVAGAGHEILLCVTQPDKPQGRGQRVEASPVKQAALRLGLAVAQPERLAPPLIAAAAPEVGVVASYGRLIPPDVLAVPRHGMLGVHPSLLPKYRGAAPVTWALLNGDPITGVSIYRLTAALDAGDVAAQERVAIGPEEDAVSLTRRLAAVGAQALLRVLEALAAGGAKFFPQDRAQASEAPKLAKAQGRIDWRLPAQEIARLVRATAPWPGATTTLGATAIKVSAARAAGPAPTGAAPGTIVDTRGGLLRVATGDGALEIAELQPAGRRRMRAHEFLAGHRVGAGDRFGRG